MKAPNGVLIFLLMILFGSAAVAHGATHCEFNKVELSPDADIALIWRESHSPLDRSTLIGSSNKFHLVTRDGKNFARSAGSRILNMQWLSDDATFSAFSSAGWIYILNAFDLKSVVVGHRNMALSSIHLRLQSHLDRGALEILQNLTPPSRDELMRRRAKNPVFAIGPDLYWIEKEGSKTSIFKNTRAKRIGVQGSQDELAAYRFAGIRRRGNQYQLFGYGASELDGRAVFSKPLFDLKTGQLNGYFSPLVINWHEKGRMLIKKTEQQRSWINISASVSGDGLVVLEGDSIGNQRIRFVDDSGQDKIYEVCSVDQDALEETSIGPRQFDIQMPSSQPGAGLAILRLSAGRQKHAAVVRFNGGPLGDPLEDLWSPFSHMISARTADQLVVAYPGSLGIDYKSSMAFLNFDADAFTQSILDLAGWIDEQGYSEVYIVGVSFGAMPAYNLAMALDSKVRSVHLVVPLLEFPESGIILGQANQFSREAQEIYERGVFGEFGNRKTISDFYQGTFSDHCVRSRTFLYFGEDDNNIDEHQLPRCFNQSDRRIYVDTDHEGVVKLKRFLEDFGVHLSSVTRCVDTDLCEGQSSRLLVP